YQQGFNGEPMTPQFADLATSVGAQVFMTADYGDGTPQSNAAWVAYCNAIPSSTVIIGKDSNGVDWKTAGYWAGIRAATPLATDDGYNFLRANHSSPYGFKNWEIGNECYGTWENDTHTPQWDPVVYANFTKQTLALMKQVDPTVKVGVVVTAGEDDFGDQAETVTNPVTGQQHKGWTAVLFSTLNSLGTIPDFVIYHNYAQGPGGENDSLLLHSATSWAVFASSIRTILNQYFGTAPAASVQLVSTENNSVSFNPGKQTTSLVNGLYLADSVASLLQTEFRGLVWWNMHNAAQTADNNSASLYGWRQYGDYGILATNSTLPGSAQDTPYPTYFAFKLLSHFARNGDQIVQATSSYSNLAVYACKQQNGSLALLVINKHPTADLTANLSIAGYTPAGSATTYQYGAAQDTAQSQGQSVDLAQSTVAGIGASFSMTFPAYSMTVVSLAPAQTGIAINAGGGASGSFAADSDFTGGSVGAFKAAVDTAGVANAAPAAVYQTQRFGNFGYNVTGLNPGASYTVRLHFAESWFGPGLPGGGGKGSRVFNVAINGVRALINFDVFSAAGGANKADVQSFTAAANSNGAIFLQFSSVVNNAEVNGIEVVPLSGQNSPPAPKIVAQINAGGSSAGSFAADTGFSGGSVGAFKAAVNTAGVANAAPAAVYQTQRFGNFGYNVTGLTPGASYTVRLHFAESWFGPGMPGGGGKGSRVFNIAVNGSPALTNFDVLSAAGAPNLALVEDLPAVANANGAVSLQFTSLVNNAEVNGIEVISPG
ncbi:MAG TPA: malectin domain-containing carbohydrate-binding protein, partial [Capsulimonadaceae bacterium]|nr:malectin domain-containing carbohydrate-binding protein [Capsulimonadaceae bacterium]